MVGKQQPRSRVTVITPVFNDWSCVPLLAEGLAPLVSQVEVLNLMIVDDGSSQYCTLEAEDFPSTIARVEILHLGCNLGHQRAIAIGIAEVVQQGEAQALIVIDSDGEDAPSDALLLLSLLEDQPDAIIVAQRKRRRESLKFRLSYGIYKFLFRILTGKVIDFGNFSAMGIASARRLAFMPELWNHFPATIMRSKVALLKLPLDRQDRWIGRSKMNLVSLINHGLGAIAAFNDVAFARLLVISVLAVFILIATSLAILIVRFSTTLAIPGWTTTAIGFSVVALLQVLAMFAVITFLGLSSRSSPSLPPIEVAGKYIHSKTKIR